MALYVNKSGRLEKVADSAEPQKNYWVARFDTKCVGQTLSRFHYCSDYDFLKHFVKTLVEFYNSDTLSEGLTEDRIEEELIKEISKDTWKSVNTKISIHKVDAKIEVETM
jgi:hypothetical protein